MTNTKDLKDIIKLVAHLGNGVGKSLDDGKVQVGDIINFALLIQDVPVAIVGIQNVPAEIARMDTEDKTELQEYFKAEFDIPQDAVEAAVETAIDLALKIIDYAIITFTSKK